MSPRQAGQSVASWWTHLSDVERAFHAAIGIGALAVTAWVLLSGFLALPHRVDAVEARVGALEAKNAVQDSAITAQGNGMEYLICDRLTSQGMEYRGRHTQQECAADIIAPGR